MEIIQLHDMWKEDDYLQKIELEMLQEELKSLQEYLS